MDGGLQNGKFRQCVPRLRRQMCTKLYTEIPGNFCRTSSTFISHNLLAKDISSCAQQINRRNCNKQLNSFAISFRDQKTIFWQWKKFVGISKSSMNSKTTFLIQRRKSGVKLMETSDLRMQHQQISFVVCCYFWLHFVLPLFCRHTIFYCSLLSVVLLKKEFACCQNKRRIYMLRSLMQYSRCKITQSSRERGPECENEGEKGTLEYKVGRHHHHHHQRNHKHSDISYIQSFDPVFASRALRYFTKIYVIMHDEMSSVNIYQKTVFIFFRFQRENCTS